MQYSIPQLQEAFQKEADLLIDWYRQQPDDRFLFAPENQWTAAGHLHHMIKSTEPVSTGLKVPAFILRLKFGAFKGESRDYEAVVAAYNQALQEGAVATGVYVPKPIKEAEKDKLLQRMSKASTTLIKALGSWKESKLDKIQAPHPILGNISLRELLYFTIYHTSHHRKILEERYTAS